MLRAVVVCWILQGCAVINVESYPNGLSRVGIYTLGTNQTLQGLNSSIKTNGDRVLTIDKYTENESTGIMQLNKSLEAIVTSVLKVLSFGAL